HRDDAGIAIWLDRLLNGDIRPVQTLVGFLLPALWRGVLVKIALWVHEPDADERDAEVACLLAVISGEHAEAAGIDGQRLMDRELGREVGDRGALKIRVVPCHPGVFGRSRVVQTLEGGIIEREKFRVARNLLETLARDQPQHPHRIVCGGTPERVIEHAKNLSWTVVPAPPEIARELVEPLDAFGKRRKPRIARHRANDRSRPGSPTSTPPDALRR